MFMTALAILFFSENVSQDQFLCSKIWQLNIYCFVKVPTPNKEFYLRFRITEYFQNGRLLTEREKSSFLR